MEKSSSGSQASPLSPGNHTFITSAATTLSYHVIPSQTPNAHLWVHVAYGWGPGRGLLVRSLAPLLRDHYTVLCLSPRAADESSRPKDDAGNDDPKQMSTFHMTEDVEFLRTYLGIDAFEVLSGHSHGGMTALAYAEVYPDRLKELVLIAPGSLLGYDKGARAANFEHFAAIRAPQRPWKSAYERWAKLPETDEEFQEWLPAALASYLADPDRDLETLRLQFEGSRPLRIWDRKSQFGADEGEERMIPRLGSVKVRVLLLYGDEDMSCGVDQGRVVEKGINDAGGYAKLVVQERCGHFPWIEKEEEFVREVFAFLGKRQADKTVSSSSTTSQKLI